MSMVGFPLLLIPLAVYNIVVFLMPGVSFAEPLVKLPLMSGAEWALSLSDILLTLAVFLLLLELIKGARPGAKYLTDHLLSLLVFGAAAAEFLLWPRFGASTFFLLTMLALVEFLSGIALRTQRRPQAVSTAMAFKEAMSTHASAPVARAMPATAPAQPAPAASAVEPPPEPKSESKTGHDEIMPSGPSPGLQSTNGSPPSPGEPRA
jgi:hypothetical protein